MKVLIIDEEINYSNFTEIKEKYVKIYNSDIISYFDQHLNKGSYIYDIKHVKKFMEKYKLLSDGIVLTGTYINYNGTSCTYGGNNILVENWDLIIKY